MAERAAQLDMPAIALTDYGSMSGAISFMKALKEVCVCGHYKDLHGDNKCFGNNKTCPCQKFEQKKIKPIIGEEFFLKNGSSVTVLAKNLQGWKKLIKATSEANHASNYNVKEERPELSFDQFAQLMDRNLVCLTGSAGSEVADSLFSNPFGAYTEHDYRKIRELSNASLVNKAIGEIEKYKEVFGPKGVFLEISVRSRPSPLDKFLSEAIRYIGKKTQTLRVAINDSHYGGNRPEDFDDHRVIVCSGLEANYNNIGQKLAQEKDWKAAHFFESSSYMIELPANVAARHDEEEVKNTLLVADMIEEYNVFGKPMIPTFYGPSGESPSKYLEKLCAVGWKKKIDGKIAPEKIPQYKAQIRHELNVINEASQNGADLASYFLIVQDYCDAAIKRGELIGSGRGSAGGSLISFFLGITKVDPILYDLSFERFYNAGRNTKDHFSPPDIDVDFEKLKRQNTFDYIENKYGSDKFAHMITFGRLQGRAALKEVFRIKHSQMPFSQVNDICAGVCDESEISDELQEMRELGDDPSIIMWALENNAAALKEYCYLDEEKNLRGELAPIFAQAIRIEKTKKSQGKHASGVVVTPYPLDTLCPLVFDRSNGKRVAGWEMSYLELSGLVKLDVLGLLTLSKLNSVRKLLAYGETD
jgi:DNA polymerase III subunit alpha